VKGIRGFFAAAMNALFRGQIAEYAVAKHGIADLKALTNGRGSRGVPRAARSMKRTAYKPSEHSRDARRGSRKRGGTFKSRQYA
jgi:hypothetical protein